MRRGRAGRHPAYQDSLIRLRGTGVLFGEPCSGEPDGSGRRPEFPWEDVLDLLERGW